MTAKPDYYFTPTWTSLIVHTAKAHTQFYKDDKIGSAQVNTRRKLKAHKAIFQALEKPKLFEDLAGEYMNA